MLIRLQLWTLPRGTVYLFGVRQAGPRATLTGIAGYPLAGLDDSDSYIELCSYVYAHGYYPTGACTSNPDGSPQTEP